MTDDPLLKPLVCDAPHKPGMYLHLFHGRTDPKAEMDDWGTDGPYFGPLIDVHVTYLHNVRIKAPGSDEHAWFQIEEDLVGYNGVYYGDWEVLVHNEG